jgi:drug/metabolite transporter (DMT)-like permease
MRQVGRLVSFSPLAYMRAVFNPWILAGKLFLHEEITRARWAGILLIVAGVALVARTAQYGHGAPS